MAAHGDKAKKKAIPNTYISLFSSAGVGCYGFKEEGFECIATVELLQKRLKIQQYNNKCMYPSGYICGDMTLDTTKTQIFNEVDLWKSKHGIKDLDVLIATPPCQGMSVANHKKKDELKRNSLVVESLIMTRRLFPKFFIFENVRAFLKSICTDVDGNDKEIREAINNNLSDSYNILYRVVNFKDYGNPSSRTRTLVIGVRKDIKSITPYDIFPSKQKERTLREVIGHLPSLKNMGEISEEDIYHNFRRYSLNMENWIADIKEGESAFDNKDKSKIPHKIKDGKIVFNTQKNGDKYRRQIWDKVAPCIHTRNDILASQNTVHPTDNRVFSIREVMLMMSVPSSFNWTDIPFETLNQMSFEEKTSFLKREELNIRQNLGEAVPTVIFKQIANKIKSFLSKDPLKEKDIESIIENNNLTNHSSLLSFIDDNQQYNFAELSKIAELANAKREDNAAYYTRQDTCFSIVNYLPDSKQYEELSILEPSIGVGNFLPTLIHKYSDVKKVTIDVIDIDSNTIDILKALVKKLTIPSNIQINYIVADFLLYQSEKKYDIVIGNPPYKKLTNNKDLLKEYKSEAYNKETNNLFSFFIEKTLKLGNIVSLIIPKSLINAPEFNMTRTLMNKNSINYILDFGETAFKGVKIETISFIINTQKKPNKTIIDSLITKDVRELKQSYITDSKFPYWLLYRNDEFDDIANSMKFNIFDVFRDRQITKRITLSKGRYRVLKSRNIGNNEIISIPNYDCYINDVSSLVVSRFIDKENCILVPNLTYYPRACFMPKGCIADGSVAILTLKDENKPILLKETITDRDLAFYATEQFTKFYKIARNFGTRSLNIDTNSVFFFGKLK